MVDRVEGGDVVVAALDEETSRITEVRAAAALHFHLQDQIKIATSPASSLSRYLRTSSASPQSGNSSTSSAPYQTSTYKPINAWP